MCVSRIFVSWILFSLVKTFGWRCASVAFSSPQFWCHTPEMGGGRYLRFYPLNLSLTRFNPILCFFFGNELCGSMGRAIPFENLKFSPIQKPCISTKWLNTANSAGVLGKKLCSLSDIFVVVLGHFRGYNRIFRGYNYIEIFVVVIGFLCGYPWGFLRCSLETLKISKW